MRAKSVFVNGLIVLIVTSAALLAAAYIRFFEYHRAVSFHAVISNKAQLIDGIESYLSVQAFLPELKKRALAYEVQHSPAEPRNDTRPPFDITLVKVDRYSHLGFAGQLHISFFNDRLESVRFFPSDMDGYLQQLKSKGGIDLTTQSEAHLSDNIRVWSAIEHMGKRYVGWADVRLSDEMTLWIRRYS